MVEVHTEHVLVIPTSLFHDLGYFQGFSTDVDRYVEEILSPEHTSYRPRDQVEQDPSYKQLIPYCVFVHRHPEQGVTLFSYLRGTGQGERRLQTKRSIGVGGHISTIDSEAQGEIHPYDEGLRRELEEEVFIDAQYIQRCVGMINDDETEVGRVHLGMVHLFEVQNPAIRPRERDIQEAAFRPVKEIRSRLAEYESWSQICVEALADRRII